MLAGGEDVPIIIEADRNSRTELLVRIIDEAKLANARTISVATARN